ncbi:MAG: hypothetical protein MR009_07850, partial [Sutterellaceae bacterium]|nr:hypothetical protein [Sutterellaceae bacterium]
MTEEELEERNGEPEDDVPMDEALPEEEPDRAGPAPVAGPPSGSPGDGCSPDPGRKAEEPPERLIHASERPSVVRWFEDQIEVNVVRR